MPGADRLAGRPASREADRNRFTYRAARADIGLGRWAEAESLLDSLPGGSAHGTLLRRNWRFAGVILRKRKELAETALGQATGTLRAGFLFRLAEIELYRGASMTPASMAASA